MKPQRLLMFDYDGVAVIPQKASFDIMREALLNTVKSVNIEGKVFDNLDWKSIFSNTAGTSEFYFAGQVFKALGINTNIQFKLLQEFIGERDRLIIKFNKNRKLEYFDDEAVFTDFLDLCNQVKSDKRYDTKIFLVTGNPSFILKDRIPKIIQDLLDGVIGGETGTHRGDLVQHALIEAKTRFGFNLLRDSEGYGINAFYFDDSERAIVDVTARERIRSIWVPRETSLKYREALTPKLYDAFTHTYTDSFTEPLFTGNGKHKITPAVFVTESLSDKLLFNIDLSEKEVRGIGFIDPKAHMWGPSYFLDDQGIRTRMGQEEARVSREWGR